jgi:hypothetical protein
MWKLNQVKLSNKSVELENFKDNAGINQVKGEY